MSDNTLERAYDKVDGYLSSIKTSKTLITGLMMVDGEPEMRWLPIEIMMKYNLITSSVPHDFMNSIVTITSDGVEASNKGIRLYINDVKEKERIDFESKKWQLNISKYWWLIMLLTAAATTLINTLLTKIIK